MILQSLHLRTISLKLKLLLLFALSYLSLHSPLNFKYSLNHSK
ncbi:hypothetical protein HH_0145 [Helicobacter hepaticus ATCC 51449]|uniref:Uncharacterized protein n=1 Tax=Helicobacter hepaticus (strain ATCC 51449 / 3B1) TaxID=235279 RepID=Q7VJU8_HELHP|nr:hypothetical protein HH_0145 [Helicobacter hepaticus ATCC 51449]